MWDFDNGNKSKTFPRLIPPGSKSKCEVSSFSKPYTWEGQKFLASRGMLKGMFIEQKQQRSSDVGFPFNFWGEWSLKWGGAKLQGASETSPLISPPPV